MKMETYARNFSLLVVYGIVALILILPFVRDQGYLWDFYAYYDSIKAYTNGINPYTQVGLDSVYSSKNTLTFTYPPLMIYFFLPFVLLDADTGAHLFFLLKIFATFGLFFLWHKYFMRLNYKQPYLVLFFLFAFNATLVWDLHANNITVFEQLLLFLGFTALLQKRHGLFITAVLVAAQFKLTPAAFLLLLLFVPARPAWGAFSLGSGLFLASQAGNYLLFPQYYTDFLLGLGMRSHQTGILNPSLHAFFMEFILSFNQISLPGHFTFGGAKFLFGLSALIIFSLSVYAIWLKRWQTGPENEQRNSLEIILFFCLLHVLMHPRFKCYQYVQVLLPALYFWKYLPHKTTVPVVAFILFFPHHLGGVYEAMASNPLPGPIRKIARLIFEYMPVFATLFIWWRFVLYFLKNESVETPRESANLPVG